MKAFSLIKQKIKYVNDIIHQNTIQTILNREPLKISLKLSVGLVMFCLVSGPLYNHYLNRRIITIRKEKIIKENKYLLNQ